MKKLIFVFIILFYLPFMSCSKGEKTKEVIIRSTSEKMELPDRIKVTIDLKNLREGIINYNTLNEQNPSSLDELDIELNYHDDYIYDSQTGVVKSKSYPDY